MTQRTPTPVLIEAMRTLAFEVQETLRRPDASVDSFQINQMQNAINEGAKRLSELHKMLEQSHGAVLYFFEVPLKGRDRSPGHWTNVLLAQFDRELAK